jgi:hypothetical protein
MISDKRAQAIQWSKQSFQQMVPELDMHMTKNEIYRAGEMVGRVIQRVNCLQYNVSTGEIPL